MLAFASTLSAFGAEVLCSRPRNNAPSIAFSLTSFRKGDLDRNCGQDLKRAAEAGFTTVTLVPAFAYDKHDDSIVPNATLNKNELTRCLEKAWNAGFHIVYQPHLDSLETLNGTGENGWRAHFEVEPDSVYDDAVFGEFKVWLKRHSHLVREGEIDVIIAAELDRAMTKYPEHWLHYLKEFRKFLTSIELDDKVRIGLNPNWYPMYHPKNDDECSDYRELVGQADFIAPSFYGDWSRVERGASQIDDRKNYVLGLLSNHEYCEVREFSEAEFAIGEFGIGGKLDGAEKNIAPPPMFFGKLEYIRKRRKIYKNVLDWARENETRLRQPLYLNIWTLGRFDPVGIRPSGEVIADHEIEAQIREYTRWRCQK